MAIFDFSLKTPFWCLHCGWWVSRIHFNFWSDTRSSQNTNVVFPTKLEIDHVTFVQHFHTLRVLSNEWSPEPRPQENSGKYALFWVLGVWDNVDSWKLRNSDLIKPGPCIHDFAEFWLVRELLVKTEIILSYFFYILACHNWWLRPPAERSVAVGERMMQPYTTHQI